MEKQTENLDYIKEFFINSNVEISISNFIIAVVISALLALIIKYVYLNCSQTLSNKQYFSDLFVPLSIITCLVITVIKFSLALSLGLVGALSIVRFRAAIKEPEELIYLFLVIGIGLAAGANQFLIAIIATLSISVIIIILSNIRRRKNISSNNELNVNVIQIEIKNRSLKIENAIKIFEKYSNFLNLKTTNINDQSEIYVFWVEFKNKNALLKSISLVKNLDRKNVNVSFYSTDNVHE